MALGANANTHEIRAELAGSYYDAGNSTKHGRNPLPEKINEIRLFSHFHDLHQNDATVAVERKSAEALFPVQAAGGCQGCCAVACGAIGAVGAAKPGGMDAAVAAFGPKPGGGL